MPRNVRNFWIDASIDGRASDLAAGPASKDGGFYMVVRMRDDGSISTPASISGTAMPDGTLVLRIHVDGHEDIVVKTSR